MAGESTVNVEEAPEVVGTSDVDPKEPVNPDIERLTDGMSPVEPLTRDAVTV